MSFYLAFVPLYVCVCSYALNNSLHCFLFSFAFNPALSLTLTLFCSLPPPVSLACFPFCIISTCLQCHSFDLIAIHTAQTTNSSASCINCSPFQVRSLSHTHSGVWMWMYVCVCVQLHRHCRARSFFLLWFLQSKFTILITIVILMLVTWLLLSYCFILAHSAL